LAILPGCLATHRSGYLAIRQAACIVFGSVAAGRDNVAGDDDHGKD